MTIGYPMDAATLRDIRQRYEKHRTRREDLRLLMDAYEALVLRVTKADMALHGHDDGTHWGADMAARLESERVRT